MQSSGGLVVSIIGGNNSSVKERWRLEEKLGKIGVTAKCWVPTLNFFSEPMNVVRQAADGATVMVFLGQVRGLAYSSAKGLLAQEFPNLKVFYADPGKPSQAVKQVRALLPRSPSRWRRAISALARKVGLG